MSDTKLYQRRYTLSRERLKRMLNEGMPDYLIQSEARVLLEAYYGGPVKTLVVLTKRFAVKRAIAVLGE